MKKINQFIQEKLRLDRNININTSFSDEELRKDYSEVSGAYTKAEKQKFCEKYDIISTKIREIQLVILDHLRENRKNKKEFTKEDFQDIIRYDLPEKYEKFIEYLDKEPIKFVKFLLKTYENIIQRNHISILNPRSIADKYKVKRYNQLKKYLNL